MPIQKNIIDQVFPETLKILSKVGKKAPIIIKEDMFDDMQLLAKKISSNGGK